jgi:two-component system, chemotaxis family, protein-glutamate methylesterase/glutaminase
MRTKTAQQPANAFCHGCIVMGGSAGGFSAISTILSTLAPNFKLPILYVQHLHPSDDGNFVRHLGRSVRLPVIEPNDKEVIKQGRIYTAPANYHMLVERTGTIALSTVEKVNWSRPSIDVLFESAALAMGGKLIAVILSGASNDGAAGIEAVKAAGGLTIAQDPATAESPLMPQTAIDTGKVDEVLTVEQIGQRLMKLGRKS